jgi:hypothetical protein
MTARMISVLVYSYKGKNLPEMVKNMVDTADSVPYVVVKDQNPLTREDKIKAKAIDYYNIFWDHQYGPASYRHESIYNGPDGYRMMVTDDIIFTPGWDTRLMDFVADKNIIVSGQGTSRYRKKDKYFLTVDRYEANNFILSQIIDNNFMFGSKETFSSIQYPIQTKYFGESELLSIECFCNNIDIYSAPSDLYTDLKNRTLENLYAPFSLEHKYNDFINLINEISYNRYSYYQGKERKLSDFLEFHGLKKNDLKPIPYQNDDVLYDPNTLKFVDIGGERFLASTKAIY